MSSSDGARNARCAARYIAAISRTDLGIRECSDDTEGNTFVEAAHPVPLEIDGHVLIADGTQLAHETLAGLGLERARQFVAADLEAGQCRRAAAGGAEIVVPDAAHTEPHRANRGFGALDDSQLLSGHFRVVRDARREAGRGWLIPRRQAGASGQLANLRLGQPHFVERAADAELAGRLPAGPIVAAIVRIAAVGDDGDAALGTDTGQRRVELVLAVVAAVGGIGAIFRTFELSSVNDFVPQPELARETQRELAVMVRITGAVRGDAERGRTENRGSFPRQICAVGAAAEGNQQRLTAGQRVTKRARLVFKNRLPVELRRRPLTHSSKSSSSSASSSSSRSSSSSASSSSISSSSSSRSSSSSSVADSSSSPPTSTRLFPHSGQLKVSPSSKSSVSISSNSHSGQVAIRAPCSGSAALEDPGTESAPPAELTFPGPRFRIISRTPLIGNGRPPRGGLSATD